MKLPAIIVNFKTYAIAGALKGLELARLHEKVAKKTGVTFAVVPQTVDLRMIVSEVDIPVFAQHFDAVEPGAHTGHVTPHVLKEIGVYGTLLNHAEKPVPLDQIEKSIELARYLGLFTVVCANTAYMAKAISDLDPDLVAVEPPELIGGDVSVTSSPQIILDTVEMIGKNKVMVGAGVRTGADVREAIRLGARGVLLASGVIKSIDPEKTLFELASGVKNI